MPPKLYFRNLFELLGLCSSVTLFDAMFLANRLDPIYVLRETVISRDLHGRKRRSSFCLCIRIDEGIEREGRRGFLGLIHREGRSFASRSNFFWKGSANFCVNYLNCLCNPGMM